ncbi:MAG: amidohydrolase [Chloroflexi bacterium]|nr:amidohydrolase [Chloroflexota bacterium]
MAQTVGIAEARTPAEVAVEIVDVDVHPAPRSNDEVRAYIPEPWRSRPWPEQVFAPVPSPIYVSPGFGPLRRTDKGWDMPINSQRRDATPPSGGPACSDPAFAEKQLFQDAGVDIAILLPLSFGRPMSNPDHEAACVAAVNTWLAETWLSRYNAHGRYRGAIRISAEEPELAAREIERWAGHPHFVEVMLVPYASTPFGQPYYDPIYEAAARHDLPIAIHVNRGAGMTLLTPVGHASYFWEHHGSYPLLYGTQLISLLCEGVFERFPSLKIGFIEGGVSWAAPLLWRLDRHWRELRSEVPALRRRPSDYVRESVHFSTQPIEEPREAKHLDRVLEWLGAERTLLFATDYPHWDGDYDPKRLFRGLPADVRRRIMRDNALELFRLPLTRPADRAAA